jgi:uncharacterized protein YkwD
MMKFTPLVYLLSPIVLSACNSGSGNTVSQTEDPVDNNNINVIIGHGICPASVTIADEALDIINKLRTTGRDCGSQYYPGTSPLIWNNLLEQVAQSHSDDMATYNFFNHTGSDGLNPGERLTGAGYDWQIYGENISGGSSSLQETINGLMESPGHCANIMKTEFTEMSMTCSYNISSDYKVYWTQVFTKPE